MQRGFTVYPRNEEEIKEGFLMNLNKSSVDYIIVGLKRNQIRNASFVIEFK
jgi:hypothetical protein